MDIYNDLLFKRKPMEWHRNSEPAPKNAKVVQSSNKCMTTIFWDVEGILLTDFKEHNATVHAEYDANLRQAFAERRGRKLTKGMWLLHVNVPLHKANSKGVI